MAELSLLRPDDDGPARTPQTAPHPRLRERTLVLVGLMGVGKTTIGRALAAEIGLPFRDADHEIELAARRTVAEIFSDLGEAAFRDGERRVIARLATQEPAHVLSVGGGAFMNAHTREVLSAHAITIWLKTDLAVLARRVGRKSTRPLLVGRDPMDVLRAQAEQRYPAYGEAALVVDTGDLSQHGSTQAVLSALHHHLGIAPGRLEIGS